jgi:hypothetical protein
MMHLPPMITPGHGWLVGGASVVVVVEVVVEEVVLVGGRVVEVVEVVVEDAVGLVAGRVVVVVELDVLVGVELVVELEVGVDAVVGSGPAVGAFASSVDGTHSRSRGPKNRRRLSTVRARKQTNSLGAATAACTPPGAVTGTQRRDGSNTSSA